MTRSVGSLVSIVSWCMFALIISGCQNIPGNKSIIKPVDTSSEVQLDYEGLWSRSAFELATEIDAETNPAEARVRRLIAANKLIDNQQIEAARVQLNLINHAHISGYEQTLLDLAESKIAYQRDRSQRAKQLFEQPSLSDNRLKQLPESQFVTAKWLHATTLEQQKSYFNAAMTRIDVSDYIEDELYEQNAQLLWQDLNKTKESKLIEATQSDQSFNRLGWIDLALKANTSEPQVNIEAWQSAWASHPAYEFSEKLLNGELELSPAPTDAFHYGELPESAAKKITVLLPLSGRFAKIGRDIENGIRSAGSSAELVFIDTETLSPEGINQAIQTAASEGSELVIGPLMKSEIEQLQPASIPVIALNKPEHLSSASNVFYLSLDPADEARQVAEAANRKGKNRALILYPETAWGERIAQEFVSHYQGDIIDARAFKKDDNLNSFVKSVLKQHLTEAELREALRSKDSQNLNVNVIFAIGDNNQMRQIKPALNYYYAGAIPVYSVSNAFEQINDYGNRDLRDICLVDAPVIQQAILDPAFIDQAGTRTPAKLRLYALGRDAMLLAQNLGELDNRSQSHLGMTGQLELGYDNSFQRQLEWFSFDNRSLIVDEYKECAIPSSAAMP